MVMCSSSPTKMSDTPKTRRSNKPLMERRRRERINQCLNQLKNLVLTAQRKDPTRYSKLEKADILEMTVRHVQGLQRQESGGRGVDNKYRAGFTQCAAEVTKFLAGVNGLPADLHCRVLTHLSTQAAAQTTTPTPPQIAVKPELPSAKIEPLNVIVEPAMEGMGSRCDRVKESPDAGRGGTLTLVQAGQVALVLPGWGLSTGGSSPTIPEAAGGSPSSPESARCSPTSSPPMPSIRLRHGTPPTRTIIPPVSTASPDLPTTSPPSITIVSPPSTPSPHLSTIRLSHCSQPSKTIIPPLAASSPPLSTIRQGHGSPSIASSPPLPVNRVGHNTPSTAGPQVAPLDLATPNRRSSTMNTPSYNPTTMPATTRPNLSHSSISVSSASCHSTASMSGSSVNSLSGATRSSPDTHFQHSSSSPIHQQPSSSSHYSGSVYYNSKPMSQCSSNIVPASCPSSQSGQSSSSSGARPAVAKPQAAVVPHPAARCQGVRHAPYPPHPVPYHSNPHWRPW